MAGTSLFFFFTFLYMWYIINKRALFLRFKPFKGLKDSLPIKLLQNGSQGKINRK